MKLHLGENIRENRRRLGLTQEQLADRLGVSFQSVSRWENGTTYPDMEMLPMLGKIFNCTVDSLLGCAEEGEKAPLDDVIEEFRDACSFEKWDECVRLLRIFRWDYLKEVMERGTIFLGMLHWKKGNEIPAVMEEVRLLAEACLQNGIKGYSRSQLIQKMVSLEDDERAGEFIRLHSSDNYNTTRDELMLERYHSRGEWIFYKRLDLLVQFEKLRNYLLQRPITGTADEDKEPFTCAQINEQKLKLINDIAGTGCDPKYPVSGDGEVDIFAELRIEIGFLYANQLCGCGEYDRALAVFGDMTALLEKLIDLPNHAELRNQSVMFRNLVVTKLNGWQEADDSICSVYINAYGKFGENPHIGSRTCGYLETNYARRIGMKHIREDLRQTWLDPVRDDPRYREIVRRLEECVRNKHKDGDVLCRSKNYFIKRRKTEEKK